MKRPIVVALLANVGVAAAKLIAFLFTGSSAMLAETLHSVADSGNELLLLHGNRQARKPPTAEHSFGFGAYRYFNPFLVSVAIFAVGGLFSLFEGVQKVLSLAPVTDPAWGVGVLLVALVLEGASLRTAVRRSRGPRGDRSWLEFVRVTKTPDLAVVLLEDFGAVIGLLVALAGIVASVLAGTGLWDGVASLTIGAILIAIAFVLGAETRSLLLGESASEPTVAKIRDALQGQPGVAATAQLRTLQLSPDQLLVVACLELDGEVRSAHDVVAVVSGAERRIRTAVRHECLIYLRPATSEGDPAPPGAGHASAAEAAQASGHATPADGTLPTRSG
jgi:cation diffusion facilitator family transporter